MFISKDTENLPNGFTPRCELLKGNTISVPICAPGELPAMHDATWELHMPGRTWNLVMEIGSKHRAAPSARQGLASSWVTRRGHANSQQQQQGSALDPLALQSTCLMCPQGRLASSCQSTVQGAVRGKPDSCFHSLDFTFGPAKKLIMACEGLAHILSIHSMDSLW